LQANRDKARDEYGKGKREDGKELGFSASAAVSAPVQLANYFSIFPFPSSIA
jgi:hypothetical protein